MKRILCHYWYHLSIVTRVGSYYINLFKGYRGVTQGCSLSTTIFNMVSVVVVSHWVTLVAG